MRPFCLPPTNLRVYLSTLREGAQKNAWWEERRKEALLQAKGGSFKVRLMARRALCLGAYRL
eukprot:365306-Chlamydomonas_euryale.AAC.2